MKLTENRNSAFEHRHRPDLDGIRGVLASSVMFLHFGVNSFIARITGGLWQGFAFDLSVDVFFVLSGFVLTASFMASRDRSLGRFAVKRFFRLAPVYYVTTAMLLLLALPRISPLHLAAELAMAPPLFGIRPINFPAWSICWEYFIPVGAFAAALVVRIPRALWLVILVASLAGLALADIRVAAGEDLFAIRAPLGLAAGTALFRLYAERNPAPAPHWQRYALFITLLLMMATSRNLPLLAAATPFLAVALIWSAAGNASPVLNARLPQWLGIVSYTVYMAHVPVLAGMIALFGDGMNANALAKVAAMLATFGVAAGLTRFVELPGMGLGKRISARLAGA